MAPASGRRPTLVVHADWSVDPRKRWLCQATLAKGGGYCIAAPRPVGDLDRLLAGLRAAAPAGGPVLAGFDFPLGVPGSYARRAGIADFRTALKRFGRGRWKAFYEVAAAPGEISPWRPFFPARAGRKGEHRQIQLARGLGVARFDDLLREVDRATGERPAASVLFWTLGGKQVGKAAIAGWRDLVAPALAAGASDIAMWPFDGALADCLDGAAVTLVEAYPAEYYRQLGLPLARAGSKRRQQSRRDCAPALTAWAQGAGVELSPDLHGRIVDGFGPAAAGEDPFDAVVGAFGLLNVVLGPRPPYEPVDAAIRRIEGWILGQRPGA